MKKSLIVAGIIVASGVVWTGGAWITGKQLEGRFAEMVKQVNAQILRSMPNAGIEMSYQNYQRGIFSSRLQLVISPVAGSKNSWLKADQRIVLDEWVDHGPFPLTQLKSFNPVPAMASVKTLLVNNPVSKPLFGMAAGESPLEIYSRISYSGDSRSTITLKPLNYQHAGGKLAFSGGQFQLDADSEGNRVAFSGKVPGGQMNAVNQYNQKVHFTFTDLQTTGSSRLTDFDMRTGRQKLSLENATLAVEDQDMIRLDGVSIEGQSGLADDGKTINSQLDALLNSLKVQNQDLGSGRLTLQLNHIDGQAWRNFNQQYSAQSQALLAQPEIMQDPQLYQQKIVGAFFDAFPQLLQGEPVVTIAPLSWKNAKGESALNLSLALKAPSAASGKAQTPEEKIDQLVKSLESKLTIPVDMAVELMTRIAILEGHPQEEAAKLAKQQVDVLASLGQMFHLTTIENNIITTSLQYASGQVTLNGKKMSLNQLAAMFDAPEMLQK